MNACSGCSLGKSIRQNVSVKEKGNETMYEKIFSAL